ncbi:MAG: TatD family hydrolase [Patescibacteria group bacterium]
MFVDTHCHIHESGYDRSEDAYERALRADVSKMVCVGTDDASSKQAIAFAATRDGAWASVGVHPHESIHGFEGVANIMKSMPAKLVAMGEIGLDYFYTHSPRDIQIQVFEAQLQLAADAHLPVIFHVREAFEDFWPIYANFTGLKGVLHSYTDSVKNLDRALVEGLFVGVNGISTFSKTNQDMWDRIPLERMLLETDSPFLTPAPHRGKVNEPAFVKHVAEYHAKRRAVELEHLARVTSTNASKLFSL